MGERDLHLPDYVLKAINHLERKGHEAFVVGGCVRDSLLSRPAGDFDLATSALPEETREAFSGFSTIDTGIKHGTLTVLINHHPLEITTYRTDGTYSDARHPDEVTFVRSLKEDLARRDFTVNAMAYHPKSGLFDPFLGREDLLNRLLRAVGEPQKRMREDALRIVRGLRFTCQLGFEIERDTLSAMLALKGNLALVSVERIAREMNLALTGEHAGEALNKYPELVETALPELLESDWQSALPLLAALNPDPALRWAALFVNAGPHKVEAAMNRLKQSKALREETLALLNHVHQPVNERTLKQLISSLGYATAQKLLVLRRALAENADEAEYLGQLEKILLSYQQEGLDFSLRGLSVTGKDLMNLGYLPKEPLGQALNRLLTMTLLGDLPNDKALLLDKAREWLTQNQS